MTNKLDNNVFTKRIYIFVKGINYMNIPVFILSLTAGWVLSTNPWLSGVLIMVVLSSIYMTNKTKKETPSPYNIYSDEYKDIDPRFQPDRYTCLVPGSMGVHEGPDDGNCNYCGDPMPQYEE